MSIRRYYLEPSLPINQEAANLTDELLNDTQIIEREFPKLYQYTLRHLERNGATFKQHFSDTFEQLIDPQISIEEPLLWIDDNIALHVVPGDIIGPKSLSYDTPAGKELIDFLSWQDLSFMVKKKVFYDKNKVCRMVYIIHEDYIYHSPEEMTI